MLHGQPCNFTEMFFSWVGRGDQDVATRLKKTDFFVDFFSSENRSKRRNIKQKWIFVGFFFQCLETEVKRVDCRNFFRFLCGGVNEKLLVKEIETNLFF